MSGTLNKVIVVGRLGRDPEVRSTQSGAKVATLSVATDEGYTGRDGQRVEKTEWHRVVLWDKGAELAERLLSKGRLVLVEGKLETRKWQADDGSDRYSTEIRAFNFTLLDPKPVSDDEPRSGRTVSRKTERAIQEASSESPFDRSRSSEIGPATEAEDDIPF